MTPAYFKDMEIIDERLKSLEKKTAELERIVIKLLRILIKQEGEIKNV